MTTGGRWQLGRRPALDGLRGIAVLMVLISHAVLVDRWRGLGAAGVSIFFTLSGFLITSLLLEERADTGRTDLLAFYRRRARRLLPALGVVCGCVMALGLASPAAVAASLLYVANWFAAMGGDLGSLSHTWSLGIEEQFYLAWPLVVIGLAGFGNRVLLWVAVGGSAVSLLLRTVLFDGSEGSGYDVTRWAHTRADGLLIGCALAILLHGGVVRRSWPLVASLGTGTLVAVGALGPEFRFTVIPTAAAWLTSLVILAVARGDYSGWLAWRPLVLVGQRSYGLYLWHLPVLYVAFGMPLPLSLSILVALAASWGMALLSWRYVEEPFLRNGRARCPSPAGRVLEDGGPPPVAPAPR